MGDRLKPISNIPISELRPHYVSSSVLVLISYTNKAPEQLVLGVYSDMFKATTKLISKFRLQAIPK